MDKKGMNESERKVKRMDTLERVRYIFRGIRETINKIQIKDYSEGRKLFDNIDSNDVDYLFLLISTEKGHSIIQLGVYNPFKLLFILERHLEGVRNQIINIDVTEKLRELGLKEEEIMSLYFRGIKE